MTESINRKIIIDEPTGEDFFNGKGHERTAVSLARTIRNFDNEDRAIGLDGPWGSGKSSVVEIASRHLEKSKRPEEVEHHFFTFDIWKSQGSGFRRSFLEHFITWTKQTFPEKRKRLETIEKGILGKTREIETNNQPILDWFGICVLFFLPFLPIYYFWAKNVFDNISQDGGSYQFLWSAPFVTLLLLAFIAVLVAFRKCNSSTEGISFKRSLSRVLLISSRQHQDHKITQQVREIDPNDYEFHATLRQILSVVQSSSKKVVIVLDNIDRLPKNEIMEYWALVRSIFSRSHQSHPAKDEQTITAIVPYDRNLIEGNDHKSDDKLGSEKITPLSSRELFSKTFDDVLTVAPPVLSNARDFFTKKLYYALPDDASADDGYRAYRIFCELLRIEGGKATPRQIVSFVNDLTGLYELHEGRFRLPTIAAYIAHQNLISGNPMILTQEEELNSKIISLAADPQIAKNFASIVFNVDTELAFQILLDDEIAEAAISEDPAELKSLAKTSGFDLRIHDVVTSRLADWQSTGDYGSAISNFAYLLEGYEGASKKYVAGALVDGFEKITNISTKSGEFEPYFTLFDLADQVRQPILLTKFMSAAFDGLPEPKSATIQAGINFATFLCKTKEKLSTIGLTEALQETLKKHTPPDSAEFMFGLGSEIQSAGFGFTDFKRISISYPDDSDFIAEKATSHPREAKKALAQFQSGAIVDNENWVTVANTCLSLLQSEDCEIEEFSELLEVTALAWRYANPKNRKEIKFSSTLKEGKFYRNIGECGLEVREKAVAVAFFLAAQNHLGEELSEPTKVQPNGQRIRDPSEEFLSFNAILSGEAPLSKVQAGVAAAEAKNAVQVLRLWIEFGSENREHQAVKQVVTHCFEHGYPPKIDLKRLTSRFHYLVDILGEEKFVIVLNKFGKIINNKELDNIELDDFPSGFLAATHKAKGTCWGILHQNIENELKAIEPSDWKIHIEEMNLNAQLLVEKINTSGCSLEGGYFRNPLVQVVLDVLAGDISPESDEGSFDVLISAIEENYHGEIWRTLREHIHDVTPESLHTATHLFPQLISDLTFYGDRISKAEKDNVIRHLLCPALEGNNRTVIQIFCKVEYKRVNDFVRLSNESTTDRLEGAWKSYAQASDNEEMIKNIGEKVHGKRKVKSFFEKVFEKE